ncbi:MAG: MarR family winged helix-turn-helix transcriptional regulator [Vicinamibacteria bacterium]|nr:MarR family winged helix-turn-helix transcriptional regulator [Vicinamibacteria bacterium]
MARSQPFLSEPEGLAWSGFLRSHALITRQLDADLRAAGGLTLSEFEILLHLAGAGGERRMAQIAHDLVLTGGGVTRIVARLEKEGLIERRSCPKDGRGIFAVLTPRGRAKQLAAQKVHLEGVRRFFLSHASDGEIRLLGRLFGRALSAMTADGAASEGPCALVSRESARPGRNHPG